MKIGRGSRRSIRYSVFIGILVGSISSGSGAFADPFSISTQAELEAIDSSLNANYVLLNNIVLSGTPNATYSYVAGSFLGTFDGNSKTISGLTVPLFDNIGGDGSTYVSNLVLVNSLAGVSGNGALANSVFIGSTIENIQVIGDVAGTTNNVGGLVGSTDSGVIISNSSVAGDVTGTGNFVGGLVGNLGGDISNSHTSGTVTADGGVYVGGLVGSSTGDITNSYSSTSVSATSYVGGLVGEMNGDITNSHATGNVTGNDYVGGLVGISRLDGSIITGSHATGVVTGIATNTDGFSPNSTRFLGGLVGESNSNITDSYASGSVIGIAKLDAPSEFLGGLVGISSESISNSYATGNVQGQYSESDTGEVMSNRSGGLVGWSFDNISNSYSTGDVLGTNWVGGLVGINSGKIQNSYAVGDVTNTPNGSYVGGLVGMNLGTGIVNSFATGEVNGAIQVGGLVGLNFSSIEYSYASGSIPGGGNLFGTNEGPTPENSFAFGDIGFESLASFPSILEVVNTQIAADDVPAFATDSCLNNRNPYLVSLLGTYESSCGGGTPPPNPPTRERIEREVRKVAEARATENIEKTLGFKNESPLPKNASITLIDSTAKIDIAKVKSVEIAPTANVKVSAKVGEALQISLKSESKEPVELWVKSPDGSWLLAGVITFDKDGKAILPPLQFKNAGDYTLVLNKPSADSAKGSAPLNQSGSVLVAVS